MRELPRWLAALALLSASAAVTGAEHQATPQNYRALLARLAPGDTLVLAAGEYLDGLPLHALIGEPGRPIVIRRSEEHRLNSSHQ